MTFKNYKEKENEVTFSVILGEEKRECKVTISRVRKNDWTCYLDYGTYGKVNTARDYGRMSKEGLIEMIKSRETKFISYN